MQHRPSGQHPPARPSVCASFQQDFFSGLLHARDGRLTDGQCACCSVFSKKTSGLWRGLLVLVGPVHAVRALYNIADSPDWLFTKEGFMLDPID